MATEKQYTLGEIWKTLSAIDVNEHVQSKGGLSYLSWAWAWGVMMDHYPEFQVEWFGQRGQVDPDGKIYRQEITDAAYYDGGTVMVGCRVMIGMVYREMWLPVMDHRSGAIAKPDARKISDAKMRCLVKCFGILGLGHYIYAGEDIPQTPEAEIKKNKEKLRVEELIQGIKETGAALEDSGISVPDDIRREILSAFKTANEDALVEVRAKLVSLGAKSGDE